MAKFNIGDLVRLKSGGPQLTVTRVYISRPHGETVTFFSPEDEGDYWERVVCHWFEYDVGELVLRREDFPPAALVKDGGGSHAL